MNRIRIAFVAGLLLCLTAFAYPQEPDADPRLPKQEEPKPPKAEPQKPDKEENVKPPKESKPERAEKSVKGEKQGHARPAGKSAHIPDAHFRANFGRQHTFAANRVISQTTVVAGQTQFVYVGYTFIILDPWPSAWLFSDDCYIDFMDDDYFLFDASHPGLRVALFVQG